MLVVKLFIYFFSLLNEKFNEDSKNTYFLIPNYPLKPRATCH